MKKKSTYLKVKSLCPLNIPVNVVFYIEEDEKIQEHIIRDPVLGMAVYDLVDYETGETERLGEGCCGFVIGDAEEGLVVGGDIERVSNFLGYEINETRDWQEEIEEFKTTSNYENLLTVKKKK